MRYYKIIENGKLTRIGIGLDGVEITEEEYNQLLSEIHEKAALVDQVYSGEKTLVDVPADWREEIETRVNEHRAEEEAAQEEEATVVDLAVALEVT